MGPNTQGAARLVELTELYVAAKVIALGEHGKGMKPEENKALVVEALNLAQQVLNMRNAIMADAAARDQAEASGDTITKGEMRPEDVQLTNQTTEELQAEHDAAELERLRGDSHDAASTGPGEAPATDVNASPAPVPDTERPAAPDTAPATDADLNRLTSDAQTD